jgi:uncharacterized membrane protein
MKALTRIPVWFASMGVVLASGNVMAASEGEYIDLTAHGNEPPWTLEIIKKGQKVNFNTDDDGGNFKYAKLGPTLYRDKKTTVFNVPHDDHAIKVFVKGHACQDTVTGKLYETTVIVAYDGVGYYGCGDVTAD